VRRDLSIVVDLLTTPEELGDRVRACPTSPSAPPTRSQRRTAAHVRGRRGFQCFDFDEAPDTAIGWSTTGGTVATDSKSFTSLPQSAHALVGGSGGVSPLCKRFVQLPVTLVVAFDVRADSLSSGPATSPGYALASVAFYEPAAATVSSQAVTLTFGSTYATLLP